MAVDWVPPRLRPVVGPRLDAVDAAALQRLVGMPEDDDLEFKSAAYEQTDSGRKEAALDLTAFGNLHCALVVFGMAEDGTGLATGIAPIPREGDFALWLDQVSASRIAPHLPIGVRSVDVDGGCVHVVSIPPSTRRPHAVSTESALRYPVRAGRRRRLMTESEVADSYGRRFASAADRTVQLDALLAAGRGVASRSEYPEWFWLTVALVPDMPGNLQLRGNLAPEWEQWVAPVLRDFPCYNDQAGHYRVVIGYRALLVHDSHGSLPETYRLGGELRLDGSGVLAFAYPGSPGQTGVLREHWPLHDEFVVADLVNAVGLLSEHALRSGSIGAGQIAAELILPGQASVVLAQSRGSIPGPLPGSRPASAGAISRHSLILEGAAQAGADRLAAVRLVAADLFSVFGVAAPPQITDEPELVPAAFCQDWRRRVVAWMERRPEGNAHEAS